jgi:hypothetical protein
MSTPLAPPPDCETIAELLPWHANGTLGAVDRTTVDGHIAACAACRTTLAVERRIVEAIRAPRDNVEQSPHAGWQKMAARLDDDITAEHVVRGPVTPAPSRHGAIAASAVAAAASSARRAEDRNTGRRRINWAVALGAAVAVQAAAIAVLAVALVHHRQAEELAPRFHTVANADPTLAANGPLVRVAFDRAVDESAARLLAQEVSGRLLAGPSPENVYTFEFGNAQDAKVVADKISWLRHQAHVMLVEPVVLGPRPAQP